MYSKLVCGLALASGASAAHVLVRRDGAGGHHHDAPASGYGTPPADPPATYGAPEPSYDTPATGYGVQDTSGYGVSGYGAEEAPFDISTLIIPLLIIAGLSLLFPTITTVPVARKRRHATDGGKYIHITQHSILLTLLLL